MCKNHSEKDSKTKNVGKLTNRENTYISFEIFPPKTEKAAEKLFQSIKQLVPLHPSFVSVTYGAGGTTRKLTHELVLRIRKTTDLTVVPHLTCVGCSTGEMERIVGEYVDEGITNVLALRGDPLQEQDISTMQNNDFPYALDLVKFIKKRFPGVCVGAACYPEGHKETPNRLREMELLKKKVDSGVEWLITQMFFDNYEFYDFVDRCRMLGINIPILAGIMPISSKKGMNKMAELSPGTRFPAKLLQAIDRVDSNSLVSTVGVQWGTQQVFDLLANEVDGIHFYTLNKSAPTLKIHRNLGLFEN
ncbi:MAG: methylenetetrahydrofolate reductase [NAD(P)H] [Spirochaetales bacterium]|nr:methylenetetrahydrofolate reductase [NAD(P)H] [Spirochaetales bacterium]